MRQVARVWNHHHETYTEIMDDKTYTIGAKQCIEMDKSEAIKLLRRYTPVMRGADGLDLKPKALSMELVYIDAEDEPAPPPQFKCMIEGTTFRTQKDYDAHVRSEHMARVVDPLAMADFFKTAEGQKGIKNDTIGNPGHGKAKT